jgi:hypothetical protein
MVAKPQSLAERFVTPPAPFLEGRWRVPRFTRRDVETLVKQGIIPEDASTELLSGLVVLKDRAARGEDPLTIGSEHRKTVERLSDLRSRISNSRRHVQSQQPLVCSETHVPEPDFDIIRGTLDDYDDNPNASDAWCVVEVSDASYERDAREKLAGYARAGVVQYIILNLRNRTAEVYTNPDAAAGTYAPPQVVPETQPLALRVGEDEFFTVVLAEVLP